MPDFNPTCSVSGCEKESLGHPDNPSLCSKHIFQNESLNETPVTPSDQVNSPPQNTLLPWQPIETAPNDGTVIDLWANGNRRTDCYWGKPDHSCGEAGEYCDSDWHTAEPGWVDSCFGEFLHVKDPTHWMPTPAAPSVGAGVEQDLGKPDASSDHVESFGQNELLREALSEASEEEEKVEALQQNADQFFRYLRAADEILAGSEHGAIRWHGPDVRNQWCWQYRNAKDIAIILSEHFKSNVTHGTGVSSGAPNATPVFQGPVPKGLWTVEPIRPEMAAIVTDTGDRYVTSLRNANALVAAHNTTLPVSAKDSGDEAPGAVRK